MSTNQGLMSTNQGLRSTNQGLRSTNQGLRSTHQGLRSTHQGLRSTHQGLRSTNQGLRSTNQGLRSTNLIEGLFDLPLQPTTASRNHGDVCLDTSPILQHQRTSVTNLSTKTVLSDTLMKTNFVLNENVEYLLSNMDPWKVCL